MLPRHACCVLSRLRCNGHSLLLSSYLSRIGRIENSFCIACGHSSQVTSYLFLHCPATDSLRRLLFGDSLSLYDLWSRPLGVARLLGHHGLPRCPIPLEEVRQSTTTATTPPPPTPVTPPSLSALATPIHLFFILLITFIISIFSFAYNQ